MAISGFEPLLRHEGAADSSSIEDGVLRLSARALDAAEYILSCDAKKMLSFTLGGEALPEFAKATESYLLAHLDREFRTLDYYHRIKI